MGRQSMLQWSLLGRGLVRVKLSEKDIVEKLMKKWGEK